ncbi:uncharacterized protein LOC120626346 [Pararge aegeria]|nr:uncharacterized protein LOC120626346 [Pararge aegeria]
MTSLTVFYLFICIVLTCCALPVQKSIEPLQNVEVEEVQRRILEEISDHARNKRDTYEYSYSATNKMESTVSYSMKRTEGETGGTFIMIGPGQNNQNFVKIVYGR